MLGYVRIIYFIIIISQHRRDYNGKVYCVTPAQYVGFPDPLIFKIFHKCAQLWHTIQHRTVLVIFPLILKTIT